MCKRVWLLPGLLTLAVLLAAPGPDCAQQQRRDLRGLEKVAREELREINAPGAAIGVVSGDRLVFARGVGISDVETGAPMTPDLLFRLGSTTKMFTAAALVMLAEEGKIKLDEPIGAVVQSLHPRVAAVTAHQLLSHTSGILDEAPMYGSQDEGALAREVRSWKEDRFLTEPGEIYSYSNPGYWLAGFVIEDVSRKPYADVMNERLFSPLGMTRTTLRPTVAMTYPLAQGHDARPGQTPVVVRPHANNAASWPAGSIFSNVNDLSRFVIAFMNDGRIDGRQVLRPRLIARLSAPYVDIPGDPDTRYGYGLKIRKYRGVRIVEHEGSRSGYGTLVSMVPEQHFAVIILANRTGAHLRKTAEKAAEMMIRLEPKPVEDNPLDMPVSETDKAAWVGTYFHPPARKVEIFAKEGKLFLRRGTAELPIRKTGENRFSVTLPGASQVEKFTLVRGRDGKIAYLCVDERASRKI